jgi:O-antigen/teichoic acid export membrane protein
MSDIPPGRSADSDSQHRGPIASSRTVARNTLWNLAGMVLPAVAAVVAIPVLVARLGDARFGVLTLAWGLSVLFALSDLGLARATTTLLSRAWAGEASRERSGLIWASLAGHAGLGLAAGGVFALLTPWMVTGLLEVPVELRTEARRAFYLLALSIPFVLTGNPLRSVLETTQQFRAINAVRIPSSTLNYAGPLLLAPFTVRLEAIVGVIVLTRLVGLVAFAWLAVREAPSLFRPTRPSVRMTRALVRTGGWLGVTGFALPAIASLDRVVIGARLSMADVGYYAAPYEVVTKLWFLSGSLLLVLYPVFSALDDDVRLGRTYWRAVRYLFVPTVAAAALIIAFSTEIFPLWLGPDFGVQAVPVARWLALGVVLSVVGQVPMTLLQCRGRPELPAVVHLIEVPLYALAAWWLAGVVGTVGVAMAWAGRAALEAMILFGAASVVLPPARAGGDARGSLVMTALGVALLVLAGWLGTRPEGWLAWKVAGMAASLAIFAAWSWFRLFNASDRRLLSRGALTG